MAGAARLVGTPAFAHRGVMLDVSRTRVPTMRELMRVVDLLVSVRANHLQLYIEHAFGYAGHEDVSAGASPITAGELTRLFAYAAERGVTVAANQNCLGHMSRWLRRPRYAPLAETHGAWKFLDMDRSGPFSLCPGDPGSLGLVRDLLSQQLACVGGADGGERLINIGCDEAFDIGQGRSAGVVAERGIGAVYGEYVGEVCGIAAELGGRPMFWADMAVRHPDALRHIPDDAVALVWGYEPDADFAGGCRACRDGGREVWVCPGTSSWRSLIGRSSERRANLASAIKGGLEAGATGLMVCDWGDLGHLQQWPVAEHAIAEAMEAAWTGELPASRSGWLDALGDADRELRRAMREPDGGAAPLVNAGAIFTALWPARAGYAFGAEAALWHAARDRLVSLEDSIPGGPIERDELEHTLRLAILGAEIGAWRYAGGRRPERLGERLEEIEADHRRLWLVRSRPGGLEESCAQFRDLRARLG